MLLTEKRFNFFISIRIKRFNNTHCFFREPYVRSL